MSAIASIAIDDGQSTPVTHTFNPTSTNPPIYQEDGNAAVPVIGQSGIQLSLKRVQGGDAINRAKITLRIPVLETTSGSSYAGYEAPPAVAYYLQANVEVMLPNRSTGDQRKDLRVMVANLLADSQIVDLVDNLRIPY